ncbi:MAG: hypothetical protein NT166_27180 [Candidatus Aminicenantes bacterium]|nr:hypothetical protein [Candidatus Aminicenantes bacterium]
MIDMDENNKNDSAKNVEKESTNEIACKNTESRTQEILNTAPINTQVIIQELTQKLDQAKSKTPRDEFKDPTEEFFVDSSNILNIDADLLAKYCRELDTERILLVNSFDVGVLSAFPSTILEKGQLKVAEHRILFFKGNNLKREDLNIEALVKEQIGKEKPILVIIQIFDSGAQYFLDSLLNADDQNYINNIKNALKTEKRILLFLIEHKLFSKRFKEKKGDFSFQLKYIDFLPYVLTNYHYSCNELKMIQDEINQQRKQNLWGNTDAEFYDQVIKYLKNHELNEQVESRKDKNAFLKKAKVVDAAILFKIEEPIISVLIYTSTFFPGVSYYEFEKITYLLLGMKKTYILEKIIKTNEQGEKQLVEIPTEALLKEQFRNQADKILTECCIEISRGTNGTRIMNFSTADLRNEMKAHLEDKYFSFLTEHFRIIQDSSLFFDLNASTELIENSINLFIEMFKSDPDRNGKDWFFRVVAALSQGIAVDVEDTNNEFELLEQILLHLVRKEKIDRLVFDRLADLLREMLNYSRLKGMVEAFLEQLISAGQHSITLRLVLELTQRLRFAPHFNQLYWLKQLLNRGNEETRDKAYEALRREAQQNNLRIYDFLKEIKLWLPEPDRPIEKYSMSNGYALQFLIDYAFLSIANINIDNYGDWPSKYPLFENMDEKSAPEKFEILVSWLFHPGMKYLENEDLNINIFLIIGNIFANWLFILHGPEENFLSSELQSIFSALIEKILEISNKKQQRKLVDAWRYEIEAILKEITKSNDKNIKEKRELNYRRNFIRFLVKKFKEIENKKKSKED